MIKVLILNDVLAKGGKERRIVELLKYSKQHFAITYEIIFMYEGVDYPDIYHTNFPIHFINWSNKKSIEGYKKILAITKSFQPDIIHSWSSMTDMISILLKLHQKKKFISSMIALALPFRSYKNKDYLRSKFSFPFADVITANTNAGLITYRAPPLKSVCIHNGFNYQRISQLQNPTLLKKEMGLENKFIVGMVAAFESRKDYETLINAAFILLEKYRSKIVFVLIGDGNLKESLMLKAGNYCQKDILFTGLINNVEEYIDTFNIGILCTNSNIHGEGISNSIMEYMALGKPVIATKGGGTNEILLDEETGYLIPAGNPKALAEKVVHLFNNPEIAQKMGLLGRQRIKEHFSIKSMCDNFYQLYKKVSGK